MNLKWSVVSAMAAAALLAACVASAADAKATAGKPDGKELFLSGKCNTCHSIEAQKIERKKTATAETASATGKKKPDLSGVGIDRGAPWMIKYLNKEEKLNDKLHPSLKYKGTPDELQMLASWLATMKTPTEAKGAKEAAAK